MRFSIVICFLVGTVISAVAKPNVVVFLTDDQGWGDLSVNGNTNLSTPHIDSLAEEGLILENFYVCQVCAPTRAEFLTGRYYPRTGVSGVSRGEGRLNPDETTIADVFKRSGYSTGAFGKWHNGTQAPYHPIDRGFDEFYGFTSGHWGHYFSPPLDHNRKKVRGEGYLVDDITNHAISFIRSNRDQPFFCYIPYNTPHSPMMIDDEFYSKFEGVDPEMKYHDPDRKDVMMTRAALAMCENIDWNVGRVLKAIKEIGAVENTIVVYFSDNGPNSYRWNGGMKGRKGSIDEGGLRSPCLIRWPGHVEAGQTKHEVTAAIDLLPTLAGLAGIPLETAKPIDGRRFLTLASEPALNQKPRDLFSIKNKQVSVRTERYRLDHQGRLFDIRHDRGQVNNVADAHPELVARLKKAAASYREEMTGLFEQFRERPFTIGYADSTTLPARDGIAHGTIERSSKAPNNSFFKNWTSESDAITWSIQNHSDGNYQVIVHYTCAKANTGTTIRVAVDGAPAHVETKVTEAFDPPLYDKSKERVAESHYFVKDFKPIVVGNLAIKKGTGTLRLTSPDIPGEQAIDVHSIELNRIQP